MPKTLREKLLERGWTEEEIKKTLDMLYSEEKAEKHIEYRKQTNLVIYWTTILVLTIANFLVSVVLIPFLLVLKPYQLEIVVAILGLVLGLLFNLIIRDIEHIEAKHHLIAAVFIPAVALINVFVMVTIANNFATRLNLQMHENPVFISLIYIATFLIPYTYSQFKEARQKWKKLQLEAKKS